MPMRKRSHNWLLLRSSLPQDASKTRNSNAARILHGNGKESKSYKLAGRREIWKGD